MEPLIDTRRCTRIAQSHQRKRRKATPPPPPRDTAGRSLRKKRMRLDFTRSFTRGGSSIFLLRFLFLLLGTIVVSSAYYYDFPIASPSVEDSFPPLRSRLFSALSSPSEMMATREENQPITDWHYRHLPLVAVALGEANWFWGSDVAFNRHSSGAISGGSIFSVFNFAMANNVVESSNASSSPSSSSSSSTPPSSSPLPSSSSSLPPSREVSRPARTCPPMTLFQPTADGVSGRWAPTITTGGSLADTTTANLATTSSSTTNGGGGGGARGGAFTDTLVVPSGVAPSEVRGVEVSDTTIREGRFTLNIVSLHSEIAFVAGGGAGTGGATTKPAKGASIILKFSSAMGIKDPNAMQHLLSPDNLIANEILALGPDDLPSSSSVLPICTVAFQPIFFPHIARGGLAEVHTTGSSPEYYMFINDPVRFTEEYPYATYENRSVLSCRFQPLDNYRLRANERIEVFTSTAPINDTTCASSYFIGALEVSAESSNAVGGGINVLGTIAMIVATAAVPFIGVAPAVDMQMFVVATQSACSSSFHREWTLAPKYFTAPVWTTGAAIVGFNCLICAMFILFHFLATYGLFRCTACFEKRTFVFRMYQTLFPSLSFHCVNFFMVGIYYGTFDLFQDGEETTLKAVAALGILVVVAMPVAHAILESARFMRLTFHKCNWSLLEAEAINVMREKDIPLAVRAKLALLPRGVFGPPKQLKRFYGVVGPFSSKRFIIFDRFYRFVMVLVLVVLPPMVDCTILYALFGVLCLLASLLIFAIGIFRFPVVNAIAGTTLLVFAGFAALMGVSVSFPSSGVESGKAVMGIILILLIILHAVTAVVGHFSEMQRLEMMKEERRRIDAENAAIAARDGTAAPIIRQRIRPRSNDRDDLTESGTMSVASYYFDDDDDDDVSTLARSDEDGVASIRQQQQSHNRQQQQQHPAAAPPQPQQQELPGGVVTAFADGANVFMNNNNNYSNNYGNNNGGGGGGPPLPFMVSSPTNNVFTQQGTGPAGGGRFLENGGKNGPSNNNNNNANNTSFTMNGGGGGVDLYGNMNSNNTNAGKQPRKPINTDVYYYDDQGRKRRKKPGEDYSRFEKNYFIHTNGSEMNNNSNNNNVKTANGGAAENPYLQRDHHNGGGGYGNNTNNDDDADDHNGRGGEEDGYYDAEYDEEQRRRAKKKAEKRAKRLMEKESQQAAKEAAQYAKEFPLFAPQPPPTSSMSPPPPPFSSQPTANQYYGAGAAPPPPPPFSSSASPSASASPSPQRSVVFPSSSTAAPTVQHQFPDFIVNARNMAPRVASPPDGQTTGKDDSNNNSNNNVGTTAQNTNTNNAPSSSSNNYNNYNATAGGGGARGGGVVTRIDFEGDDSTSPPPFSSQFFDGGAASEYQQLQQQYHPQQQQQQNQFQNQHRHSSSSNMIVLPFSASPPPPQSAAPLASRQQQQQQPPQAAFSNNANAHNYGNTNKGRGGNNNNNSDDSDNYHARSDVRDAYRIPQQGQEQARGGGGGGDEGYRQQQQQQQQHQQQIAVMANNGRSNNNAAGNNNYTPVANTTAFNNAAAAAPSRPMMMSGAGDDDDDDDDEMMEMEAHQLVDDDDEDETANHPMALP